MKCLVLAGGRGEKLWPLSRKNMPKQFIEIKKNHSVFQETIARNIPYCDEFIIITNYEYRYLVSNQMNSFQGLRYRCIFEEVPRKTASAILLSCFGLQPSELVLVVSSDTVIDTNSISKKNKLNYNDSILKAKELAHNGNIILFGKKTKDISPRFGYYVGKDDVSFFVEKPNKEQENNLSLFSHLYQNTGMLLFRNNVLVNEIKIYDRKLYQQCINAYKKRENDHEDSIYKKSVLDKIKPISIERCLIEKTSILKNVQIGYKWEDIGQLEDLEKIKYESDGIVIDYNGKNNEIYNQSKNQAVVVNGAEDLLVINANDSVYIGKKGDSYRIKDIIHKNKELEKYYNQGRIIYCPWGTYEQLFEGELYCVWKVTLLPGKTIYDHLHEKKKENLTIIKGRLIISIEGITKEYNEEDIVVVKPKTHHQISNPSIYPSVFIETDLGKELEDNDIYSEKKEIVSEKQLGIGLDPVVKMNPAFMDYIWGGKRIKKLFKKKSDLDVIAESWELSAHPSGNSIIASGRHEGLSFSRYLETVGKEVLGWKCESFKNFPILIKFIDAKENLSVQVHPDDDYALRNENEYGKNEMWYVIDSKPGSGLYIGFNKRTDISEIKKAIKNNSIMDLLNFFPATSGDVFFIPTGTIHAVGAGNLICEIQQNSNSTYRLYDYERTDKYGNKRELHIDKALDVLSFEPYYRGDYKSEEKRGDKKIRCKYFDVSILEIKNHREIILKDDSFYSIVCIIGSGELMIKGVRMTIKAGDSLFLPATNDIVNIHGVMTLIITKV